MDISYRLNKEDYVEFNYQSITQSKQVVQFFAFQKMAVGITFLAIVYVLSKKANYPIWAWGIFYFGLLGIWTLLEKIVIERVLKKVIRKEVEEEKGILGDKILSIREDGLYDISDGNNIKIEWDKVRLVDPREKYVFIFTISDLDFIIPNRYFENEEAIEEFVDEVKSHMID